MLNTTINGYTIKKFLGQGGMAEVFYAENVLGMPCAIKALKKDLSHDRGIRLRFEREAHAMCRMNAHPGIRKVMDLVEVDGRPMMLMEYLEGRTLKDAISQGNASNELRLREWFMRLAEVLLDVHAKGIIHRDIKPSNVFLTEKGEIKLLDFGISKMEDGTDHTLTNGTLGTLVYMSPEQILNPKAVTSKSDYYSLGVTFYHLLQGKLPYDRSTESDFTIQQRIIQESLVLSGLPLVWQNALAYCLDKDPANRNLEKAMACLRSTVGNDPETTSFEGDGRLVNSGTKGALTVNRTLLAVLSVVVASMVIGGGLWWFLRSNGSAASTLEQSFSEATSKFSQRDFKGVVAVCATALITCESDCDRFAALQRAANDSLFAKAFPYGAEGFESARQIQRPRLYDGPDFNQQAMVNGKMLYETYCLSCHGVGGMGDGPTVMDGTNTPPPSFDRRIAEMTVGQSYFSIFHGKGLMKGYASTLDERQRWEVIHYIEQLAVSEHLTGGVGTHSDSRGEVLNPMATAEDVKVTVFKSGKTIFRGLTHVVNIKVQNIPDDNISITVTGGIINKQYGNPDGNYLLTVIDRKKFRFQVKVLSADGHYTLDGSFGISVREMPFCANIAMTSSCRGVSRGPVVIAGKTLSLRGFIPQLENFNFEAQGRMVSHTVLIQPSGGKPYAKKILGTSWPEDVKNDIAQLPEGSGVTFADFEIVVINPIAQAELDLLPVKLDNETHQIAFRIKNN